MPSLPIGIRILLGMIAAAAGILAGLLGQAIWPTIVYRITRRGRKPKSRSLRLWVAFHLSAIIAVVFGALASVAPQTESPPPTQVALATSTPTPTASITFTPTPTVSPSPMHTPEPFVQPTIYRVGTGTTLGYGKQHEIVRDSSGHLHVIYSPERDNQVTHSISTDGGKTWSKPTLISEGKSGQEVSIAIDAADRIHMVFGPWDGGPLYYSLYDGQKWSIPTVIFNSAFGRDIAVDSANHPHVIWSIVDTWYLRFDGKEWTSLMKAIRGCWHPDIAIDYSDNVQVVCNSGQFYPDPSVRVYHASFDGIKWSSPTRLAKDDAFWSGGAAIAIDSRNIRHAVWVASSTPSGGQDTVMYSSDNIGHWYPNPFTVESIGTSAGSTGKESPAVGVDQNNVVYVTWRGVTEKGKAANFVKAWGTEIAPVTGWSKTVVLSDPEASDVWWPSMGYSRGKGRGVDIVWTATVGRQSVVRYAHIVWP